ncbi:unnamed protein product, partial [Prorocentrum cordatum]
VEKIIEREKPWLITLTPPCRMMSRLQTLNPVPRDMGKWIRDYKKEMASFLRQFKEKLCVVKSAGCALELREPETGKSFAKKWQSLKNDGLLAEPVEALCEGEHEHVQAIAVMKNGINRSTFTDTYPNPLLVRIVQGALAALDARRAATMLSVMNPEVPKLTENNIK